MLKNIFSNNRNNMSYLNSQYTAPSLNGIIEIYGDEITATNANIDNLTLNILEIKNLFVDESLNVPFANITNIQTNTIISNNGQIENLIGNTLNYNTINGNIQTNNANITNLNVSNAYIQYANINTIETDSLSSFAIDSDYADFVNNNGTYLNYSNANISNLNVDEINVLDGFIKVQTGNINNLIGNITTFKYSNINDLKGDYLTFNNGNINNFTSNISTINNNYGSNLNYENANIGNLEVRGALTLDTLTIDNFSTKKVFCERMVGYNESVTNLNVNKLQSQRAILKNAEIQSGNVFVNNLTASNIYSGQIDNSFNINTNNMNTSQLNFIPYNSISTGSEYCKDRFFRVQGTGTTFTVVSIPFPYDVRSCKYISIEGCYNDNTYITAPFTKVHTFHRNIGSNLTVQDYQYTGIINNNFINIVLRASNTTTNFNWVDIQISNTAINDFYFSFMLKERHSII